MDHKVFKNKMKTLKGAIRRAEDKILSCVAKCITADNNTVQLNFDDIRRVYHAFVYKANDIMDDLNEDNPTDEARIIQIVDLKKYLTEKLIKNEEEINERLLEVLATNVENKPHSDDKANTCLISLLQVRFQIKVVLPGPSVGPIKFL